MRVEMARSTMSPKQEDILLYAVYEKTNVTIKLSIRDGLLATNQSSVIPKV